MNLAFKITNELLNAGCIIESLVPTRVQSVEDILRKDPRLRSQRIEMEEVEKRAEALWAGLGVESVVIKMLQREFALSLEQAKRILRRVRRSLEKTTEVR